MDSTATIRSAFEATLAAFVSACPTIYRASASSMLLAYYFMVLPGMHQAILYPLLVALDQLKPSLSCCFNWLRCWPIKF